MGAEFSIGISDDELPRVAPLIGAVMRPDEAPSEVLVALLTGGTPTNRAFMIAPVLPTSFNEPEILRAQIPSGNGCTSARSLARIYGGLVSEVDGVRLLGPDRVDDLRRVQSEGDDLVLVGDPNAIGSGFFLPDPESRMLGPGSFGHSGMGGSLGTALPEREIGFGYVMNQCQAQVTGDPRSQALQEAVLACTA